jgi:hypothetical protein
LGQSHPPTPMQQAVAGCRRGDRQDRKVCSSEWSTSQSQTWAVRKTRRVWDVPAVKVHQQGWGCEGALCQAWGERDVPVPGCTTNAQTEGLCRKRVDQRLCVCIQAACDGDSASNTTATDCAVHRVAPPTLAVVWLNSASSTVPPLVSTQLDSAASTMHTPGGICNAPGCTTTSASKGMCTQHAD